MVAVVDLFGKPLMPTNEYRARKLLKQKKAKIFGYRPFTIQLTERKSAEIQPIELCMVDLCQYFEHKKLKGYADFFNSSSSFCCGVI